MPEKEVDDCKLIVRKACSCRLDQLPSRLSEDRRIVAMDLLHPGIGLSRCSDDRPSIVADVVDDEIAELHVLCDVR